MAGSLASIITKLAYVLSWNPPIVLGNLGSKLASSCAWLSDDKGFDFSIIDSLQQFQDSFDQACAATLNSEATWATPLLYAKIVRYWKFGTCLINSQYEHLSPDCRLSVDAPRKAVTRPWQASSALILRLADKTTPLLFSSIQKSELGRIAPSKDGDIQVISVHPFYAGPRCADLQRPGIEKPTLLGSLRPFNVSKTIEVTRAPQEQFLPVSFPDYGPFASFAPTSDSNMAGLHPYFTRILWKQRKLQREQVALMHGTKENFEVECAPKRRRMESGASMAVSHRDNYQGASTKANGDCSISGVLLENRSLLSRLMRSRQLREFPEIPLHSESAMAMSLRKNFCFILQKLHLAGEALPKELLVSISSYLRQLQDAMPGYRGSLPVSRPFAFSPSSKAGEKAPNLPRFALRLPPYAVSARSKKALTSVVSASALLSQTDPELHAALAVGEPVLVVPHVNSFDHGYNPKVPTPPAYNKNLGYQSQPRISMGAPQPVGNNSHHRSGAATTVAAPTRFAHHRPPSTLSTSSSSSMGPMQTRIQTPGLQISSPIKSAGIPGGGSQNSSSISAPVKGPPISGPGQMPSQSSSVGIPQIPGFPAAGQHMISPMFINPAIAAQVQMQMQLPIQMQSHGQGISQMRATSQLQHQQQNHHQQQQHQQHQQQNQQQQQINQLQQQHSLYRQLMFNNAAAAVQMQYHAHANQMTHQQPRPTRPHPQQSQQQHPAYASYPQVYSIPPPMQVSAAAAAVAGNNSAFTKAMQSQQLPGTFSSGPMTSPLPNYYSAHQVAPYQQQAHQYQMQQAQNLHSALGTGYPMNTVVQQQLSLAHQQQSHSHPQHQHQQSQQHIHLQQQQQQQHHQQQQQQLQQVMQPPVHGLPISVSLPSPGFQQNGSHPGHHSGPNNGALLQQKAMIVAEAIERR